MTPAQGEPVTLAEAATRATCVLQYRKATAARAAAPYCHSWVESADGYTWCVREPYLDKRR